MPLYWAVLSAICGYGCARIIEMVVRRFHAATNAQSSLRRDRPFPEFDIDEYGTVRVRGHDCVACLSVLVFVVLLLSVFISFEFCLFLSHIRSRIQYNSELCLV